MPTFTIHTRHSWPPGNYTPRHKSTTFNPSSDLSTDVDENPFAFYLSPPPPPPPLDYDYDTDPESDAGITTTNTPPRSRSRSPFSSIRSRSRSNSGSDEEDEESTVRKAGRTPGAVLRRWAGFVERTYPHLSLANLRGGGPMGPATVVVRDQRPVSPNAEMRGRQVLAVTLSKSPPQQLSPTSWLHTTGGGEEGRGRGRARRRRSRSWQPPGEDLWTVLEDEEDDDPRKISRDAEELHLPLEDDDEDELARKVREDVGMSLSFPGPGPLVWGDGRRRL